MLDKSITSALLALRAQIIRGNLDGLDNVEALLVQRGIDPAAHHVPRPIPRDSCKLRDSGGIVSDGGVWRLAQ